ncbi:MAG: ATP-binding protein [bacterium]
MTEKTEKRDDELAPQAHTGDTVRSSWPFSLDKIRKNIAHCSPAGKDALVSAFLWCIDAAHPVRKDELSERIGYSDNVLYKLYTGRYRDPDGKLYDVPEELIERIRDFLRIERERFLGGETQFVLTPTAKRIITACDLGRESQTPVFVIGRSHIGKTWALRHYADTNNHGRTVYIRMKAASGLGGMVRRIAEKVGQSPRGNTADLIDNIKHAITKDMLLIFDEVHLLQYTYRKASFFACMEVIREIYDETGCGMLLSGTKILLDRITEARNGEMEQLLRRGVHRILLPETPTRADVNAILEHNGLEFPARALEVRVQRITEKPYDVLRQLSKRDALKSITERLRYGRKLAARKDDKVNWTYFLEAHLTIAKQAEQPEDDWT